MPLVFCFSILCCCPPATNWRSKLLIIAGLSLPCLAVSGVTLLSPVMAYSCQCLFHTSDNLKRQNYELDQVCLSHSRWLLSWLNKKHIRQRTNIFASSGKDSTQRHTWANLNIHTVRRKDTSKPTGLLWYSRATCHFIMARNRKGQKKRKTYESSSHT